MPLRVDANDEGVITSIFTSTVQERSKTVFTAVNDH